MELNQLTWQGEFGDLVLVPRAGFNKANGLIWPTGGRLLALAEQRYALFVVSQTTAQSMPCQQTRIIGQMN